MSITFNPNPATELEAVNLMLLSIGKAPVSTLAVPGINDVSWATTILYDTVRAVQTRRWWFNSEDKYSLTLDANGCAAFPASALEMRPYYHDQNFVQRYNPATSTQCLYDLDQHSFNLSQYVNGGPLYVNVTWCYPFEQIPQVARNYIARRAGRVFQTNAVGAQLLYQFTKEMELEAEAELQRFNSLQQNTNMFNTATRANRIYNRQPGAYRRTW